MPAARVKAGFAVIDFESAVDAVRARGVEVVMGPFPARRDQRANVPLRDNSANLLQIFGGFAQ
jgi:hypothetical protein